MYSKAWPESYSNVSCFIDVAEMSSSSQRKWIYVFNVVLIVGHYFLYSAKNLFFAKQRLFSGFLHSKSKLCCLLLGKQTTNSAPYFYGLKDGK